MKIKALQKILTFLFLTILTGLFYTQIAHNSYYRKLSTQNRIRPINIDSPRGILYDRKGRALVKNRISFDCGIIPEEYRANSGVLKKLAVLIDKDIDDIQSAYEKNRREPFMPSMIERDIALEKVIRIEENLIDLPGIVIEARVKRRYPFADALSHVVGYIGEVSDRELKRLREYGYRVKDFIGRSGIEAYYNDYLKGEDGGMQVEIDYKGRRKRVLGVKEPRIGLDVHLTIDAELQEYVYSLMKEVKGCCVIMDVKTGAILTLVSTPSFDPNIFLKSDNVAEVSGIFRDSNKPLLNRALLASYPPGSIFKIVVAAAALNSGKISKETSYQCTGGYKLGRRTFRCWKESGHGWVTVREAIKGSCNVFFYQTGRKIGARTISRYAKKFGLNKPTGIDLFGETAGLVPGELWKRIKRQEPWYEGDTLNYSIGQGYLLVSPIALCRAVGVIASGGYLVKPFLVTAIGDTDVRDISKERTDIRRDVIERIQLGMRDVVEASQGTGKKAQIENYQVAGKTGTAQNPRGRTHAWFTGFCPARNAELAIVVFVENGGKGSTAAAPIAGEAFNKYFNDIKKRDKPNV